MFFGTVAVVVLITGWYIAPRRLSIWIVWGALSPLLASAIGYTAIILAFYVRHGELGADLSFGSRALIAFFFPYFVCSVWSLSAALPVLGAAGYFLLPTDTPKTTEDNSSA